MANTNRRGKGLKCHKSRDSSAPERFPLLRGSTPTFELGCLGTGVVEMSLSRCFYDPESRAAKFRLSHRRTRDWLAGTFLVPISRRISTGRAEGTLSRLLNSMRSSSYWILLWFHREVHLHRIASKTSKAAGTEFSPAFGWLKPFRCIEPEKTIGEQNRFSDLEEKRRIL